MTPYLPARPHRRFALYDVAVLYMAEYNDFRRAIIASIPERDITVKTQPRLLVMSAIADVARAAQASIEHRGR